MLSIAFQVEYPSAFRNFIQITGTLCWEQMGLEVKGCGENPSLGVLSVVWQCPGLEYHFLFLIIFTDAPETG